MGLLIRGHMAWIGGPMRSWLVIISVLLLGLAAITELSHGSVSLDTQVTALN